MLLKLIGNLLMFCVAGILLTVAAGRPLLAAKTRYTSARESQGGSFSLTQLPENPRQYSLLISDGEERNNSGSFSIDQLQILRAIMVEAEKFALNGEAAGAKEPITTRFMDKQEPAFVVDVQKDGNQSRLFITLKTEIGRMTWEAGRIIRSTRREEGFFFDLMSRLISVLPKLPTQPSK
jgi:hypothetical protein